MEQIELELTKEQESYFDMLKEKGIELTDGQKKWYAKKCETQFDSMKREFPSLPEEAFESAVEGAYYAKQLTQARVQGRITQLYYSEDKPVHTAWDLGYGDSTSIFLFQLEGKEIHILEYIEGSNEPLTYYLKMLRQKDYIYGTHLVPHDAAHHEYSSGLTRIETARKNGFNLSLVPMLSIDEGIDATRYLFPRMWFDEQKCALAITHLDNYKRAWNAKQGCWGSRPLHNESSHCADALRSLSTGFELLLDSKISDDWVDAMQKRHNPQFI